MKRKKQRENQLNKGLKEIIFLYKGSREALLEMVSTILGTLLKPGRRTSVKNSNKTSSINK